ncbi:MAG: sensor histidine kinase [Clostridiaceae bacterium]|nr:sensor histidine kinase [Clostridiaceae bacterium]
MGSGFSAILVIEAIFICIVSFISINLFYHKHTELLYNESAEVLNLYFSRVEDRLREVENLSFSILSDLTIQEHFNNINDYGETYEGYMSQQKARNKLLYKLFLVEGIESIEFIDNNNQVIHAGYKTKVQPSADIETAKKIAYETYGTGTWETNLSGDGSISFVRLIRSITNPGFNPLGVLVINIDVNSFMSYSSVISSKFHSDILIIAGDDLVYSAGQHPVNAELLSADNYFPYKIKNIDGENYFITERKTDYVDWRFISMIRCDELLADINNLKRLVIVIFILSIVLSTGIGFNFSGLITRTLVRLSRGMKHVEKGDYNVVLAEPDGRLDIEEVSQLRHNFNIMAKRIDYLVNDVLKKEIRIREFQYKILQQQINPHFLYNTLDTIHWMSLGYGCDKISDMVRSLSNLFRGALELEDIVTLNEETRFLKDYITIQKIRFEERLDFRMEIDDEYLGLLIPKLTLQPIVENSINYCLEKYEGICSIRIECRKRDSWVELSISDNGPGMEQEFVRKLLSGESKPTKTGIGLKNIDERLRIFYGDEYGIIIESGIGKGTTVIIRVPTDEKASA